MAPLTWVGSAHGRRTASGGRYDNVGAPRHASTGSGARVRRRPHNGDPVQGHTHNGHDGDDYVGFTYGVVPLAAAPYKAPGYDVSHELAEQRRPGLAKEIASLEERPETRDLLRQRFAELSLWPLPDQLIVQTEPVVGAVPGEGHPYAASLADPLAALEERRLVLATALRHTARGGTVRRALRTRSFVRSSAFRAAGASSYGTPVLRGDIDPEHAIVASGATLVSIHKRISSGTAQGDVFSAVVGALPFSVTRYTPFGAAAGGPEMQVRAALKKSAVVDLSVVERINSARQLEAELGELWAAGHTTLTGTDAMQLVDEVMGGPGEWSLRSVDAIVDAAQLWPAGGVDVDQLRRHVAMALAREERAYARDLADPGGEARVDTVMAYANSLLVERLVSPGFALYYGSCVARDTSSLDRAHGRRGDLGGSVLGGRPPVVETPIVEVLITQALDGSVNQLVQSGWYGGRAPGVPPQYGRINDTLGAVDLALLAMQAEYDAVHNDLHTGNVLYERVAKNHRQYHRIRFEDGRRLDVWLAMPDGGRAMRIIDFGRATASIPLQTGGPLRVASTVAGQVLGGRRDLYSRSADLVTFTRALVDYVGGDLKYLALRPHKRAAYLSSTGATEHETRQAAFMWRLIDGILGCGTEGTVWDVGQDVCHGHPSAIRENPLAVARIRAAFGSKAIIGNGGGANGSALAKQCAEAADWLAPFEPDSPCRGGEPTAYIDLLSELYGIESHAVPADALVYTITVPDRIYRPIVIPSHASR